MSWVNDKQMGSDCHSIETQVVTTKAFEEEGGWVVQERGNFVRYVQARPGGLELPFSL